MSNTYTVKIVTNKATITSTDNQFTKKTFNDFSELIAYIKTHHVVIINPEALPPAFQKQIASI